MFCVSDCARDGIRPGVPEPTGWEHVGNQIDAAMIFASRLFAVDTLLRAAIIRHRDTVSPNGWYRPRNRIGDEPWMTN